MTLKDHDGGVTSVVFSADGNFIISGSYDSTTRIWDIDTGVAVGEPLRGHSVWVTVVAASPDGQWIASAYRDGTIQIWGTSTLPAACELKDNFFHISSIVFSMDSKSLFSGSGDGTIKIWNVHTGELITSLQEAHSGWITLAANPCGLEFVSGSWDGIIRLWDALALIDSKLHKKHKTDYSVLGEEESRIVWNASRVRMGTVDDGWVRDGEKLLFWVPLRYRDAINGRMGKVIGGQGTVYARPEVDYRKLFRYSGARWKDIYAMNKGVCR